MELRLYTWTNMYMRVIQAGIQTAHTVNEMSNKYNHNSQSAAANLYWDWSVNHKTIICLDGGYYSHMLELWKFISLGDHTFPYDKFEESGEAMNGLMTNFGIVLPEYLYEASKLVRFRQASFQRRPDGTYDFIVDPEADIESVNTYKIYTEFERDLALKLNDYSLVR